MINYSYHYEDDDVMHPAAAVAAWIEFDWTRHRNVNFKDTVEDSLKVQLLPDFTRSWNDAWILARYGQSELRYRGSIRY